MPEDDFLFLCRNSLSNKDWAVLKEARLHNGYGFASGNATLDSWTAGEQSLRAELAKLRAAKKGLETESYNRYGAYSANILDAARKAFSEESPLEAETIVLRALWSLLDELETGHLFDVDKLVAYYLRLQIVNLKNTRNKNDGGKNFSSLYETIVNKNPSREG
jgi:hypothetical protein